MSDAIRGAALFDRVRGQLEEIHTAGLTKRERTISSAQGAHIGVVDQPSTAGEASSGTRRDVLNMCANNYLGLANHPRVVAAAHEALDRWGYGLASVRFICGTQQIHRELEDALSRFLLTDATILYTSCFDANGGLFETILGPEDAVISDELNHASIIDGIRLCKTTRLRYKNRDMADLEARLVEARDAPVRLIATDGVFSMDGTIAPLAEICDLADKHDAVVMVDDSHAVGVLGPGGRGTPEHCGVADRIDILTGTLGKALGGASGGYTSGRAEIIELLRQRSRPYLFSNSVAPPIVGASLAALELISESDDLRVRLRENTRFFRHAMTEQGFQIVPGEHPIVPIMLGDARLAVDMADRLLKRGVYVIGFSFPVVPLGKARIRVQVSAAQSREDLEFAVEQFAAVKNEMAE